MLGGKVNEMFEIRLLDHEREAAGQHLGVIIAGDLTEHFSCCTVDGNVDELPQLWLAVLKSLLNGANSIALVHDPRFAWIVYREGEECFVQQRLSLEGDFQNIPPRKTQNEDGDAISEWTVKLSEIKQFVDTQQSGS